MAFVGLWPRECVSIGLNGTAYAELDMAGLAFNLYPGDRNLFLGMTQNNKRLSFHSFCFVWWCFFVFFCRPHNQGVFGSFRKQCAGVFHPDSSMYI